MHQTSFRTAGESDVEVLLDLMHELYQLERLEFVEPAARAALGRLIRDPTLGRVWLIESGGELVGYTVLTLGFSLEYQGTDAFIDEIYIKANHRGQGIGARAIELLETACRSLEVRALHLEVERANQGAQAFYRKVGFRDQDRYLMTKRFSE